MTRSPDVAAPAEPPANCALCPRLVAYREENRAAEPDWFNGAAPSFGGSDARLLVVGLAPGRTGANRTGRPFTGDYAGDLLYETIDAFGFSRGKFDARPDDGLELVDAMVTNAVRCAPPENKPIGAEITTCRQFLVARIAANRRLRVIIALGKIAHDSVMRAFGEPLAKHKFAHGARHDMTGGPVVIDTYHCSRYNTNTRRLTPDMFRDVFAAARAELDRG